MPGRIAGTVDFRHCSVAAATSSTATFSPLVVPGTTIEALRMQPSSTTLCSTSEANSERSITSVTWKHSSMSCEPSMMISGSTIGTRPCSWHSAA